jgi:hypothetical protein
MTDQHTYRIADGTVGIVNGPEFEIGTETTVQLQDENGKIIFKTGKIVEVLD